MIPHRRSAALILWAALAVGAVGHASAETMQPGGEPIRDTLLQARFAAIDGRYEECAKLADEARRMPDAVWQAHNVFATCEVFAADAVKDTITPEAYVARIETAIGAFKFLLESPGVLVADDRRRSIAFMIDELHKRIDAVRAK